MNLQDAPHVDDIDVSALGIEASKCPWATHGQLRERGPVLTHPRPGGLGYVVTGYEDVLAAFQEPAFSKDPNTIDEQFPEVSAGAKRAGFALTTSGSSHLLNTDPPNHTRLRRLVMRAFTPRRIQSLRPRIQEIVDGLLDELQEQETPDLIEDFAFQLSITMICELLGVPSEDRADFRVWSVASTTPPRKDDDLNRQVEAQKALQDYLAAHIVRRRAELAQSDAAEPADILSAMIAARDENDDNLNDSELVGMAFLLLIAGHETTVGLIGTMAHRLATLPDQRELLLQDPDLIENAVEEFLRFEGAVQRSTLRVAMEDLVIADTRIPAGSVVSMLLGSANHDPRKFENPDEVDITRDTTGHVAFGQGIHFCLGAPLARAEAQIAIGTLLRRFPGYELAVSEDELRYARTVIRALVGLPVHLKPQKATAAL